MARRAMRKSLVLGSAVSLAMAGLVAQTRAATVATWLNPVDGIYQDGSKWSTAPDYPGSFTGVYDVQIAATGSPYRVISGGSPYIGLIEALTINSPDVTFDHQATITVANLNLQA